MSKIKIKFETTKKKKPNFNRKNCVLYMLTNIQFIDKKKTSIRNIPLAWSNKL